MKTLIGLIVCIASLCGFAEERRIAKEVVVKAPVEAVWRAWTTPEGITSFFAPEARVEARVDGPFELYFNPYAPAGLRGADGMRFLALQEKKMISFTWNAPPSLPEARAQRTSVTVRFRPVGDSETQVSLSHSGWGEGGEWDKAYEYFSRAWDSVLASLQRRFAEGPTDWSEFLKRMKAFQEAQERSSAAAPAPK